MIKLLCISDLHCGEGESMINSAHEAYTSAFIERVGTITGDDRTIEHLVFLGDVVDYSEAQPQVACLPNARNELRGDQ